MEYKPELFETKKKNFRIRMINHTTYMIFGSFYFQNTDQLGISLKKREYLGK